MNRQLLKIIVLFLEGAVIGGKHSYSGRQAPTIGNNVIIRANATIIGGISIGDNSIIGAGAVVVKDVQ